MVHEQLSRFEQVLDDGGDPVEGGAGGRGEVADGEHNLSALPGDERGLASSLERGIENCSERGCRGQSMQVTLMHPGRKKLLTFASLFSSLANWLVLTLLLVEWLKPSVAPPQIPEQITSGIGVTLNLTCWPSLSPTIKTGM